MISPEEVVALYQQRRRDAGVHIDRMLALQRQYNGDIVVPLPELDRAAKAGVANLVHLGLEQFSQRVGSVMPDIYYPALRPGFSNSEERARLRRLANLAWWDMNRMGLKVRKRARYLLGYGCTPVTLHPVSPAASDKRKIPFWRVRNPLASFPAHIEDEGNYEPTDYVVVHKYPLSWLEHNYPAQARVLYKGRDEDEARDRLFEVLEYNDAEETVLVACGATASTDTGSYQSKGMGSASQVLLERFANRAGICLMVTPGRITLDRLAGHFDNMLHLFMSQAKMAAYEELAMFRSIFPEEWVVSHPNAPTKPKIVRDADAKQGIIGIVEQGTLQTVTPQPGAQVPTAIDRLERAMRLAGGIPAEFGGESGTNIRTARRGEMVLSAGVDMPLQEAQEILAASFEAENVRAVRIMKAYYGSKPTSLYLPKDGRVPRADYTPNDAFETDYNVVKYSFPGSDSASIPIEIGQRVGTQEMSLQTAREMDPAIDDPILERDRVVMEGLARALLSGLEQQSMQPGFDPTVIARLARRINTDHEQLWEAYLEIHDQLQQEQADASQAPPGAPEQQPGAGPVPPGGAAIPPPAAGQADLSQILQTLRRPANQGPAERQLAPAANG